MSHLDHQSMAVGAAEALLDYGVSLPLWRLKLPFLREWKIKVVMRRPYLGSRIRALRHYAKLGVSYEELTTMSRDQEIDFVAKHGKTIARIVAQCICRGYISGLILAPLVAWLILWRTRDEQLMLSCVIMVSLISTQNFAPIIRSMQMSNLLAPRLSQQKKGS